MTDLYVKTYERKIEGTELEHYWNTTATGLVPTWHYVFISVIYEPVVVIVEWIENDRLCRLYGPGKKMGVPIEFVSQRIYQLHDLLPAWLAEKVEVRMRAHKMDLV